MPYIYVTCNRNHLQQEDTLLLEKGILYYKFGKNSKLETKIQEPCSPKIVNPYKMRRLSNKKEGRTKSDFNL